MLNSSKESSTRTALIAGGIDTLITLSAALAANSSVILADFLKTGLEFIAVLLVWVAIRRIKKGGSQYEYGMGKLENLSGIAIIRAFVREKHQTEQFFDLNQDYLNKNLSFARVYAAFHPVLMLIIGIAVVLVLLGGGKLVIDKTITIGELTAFMLYLGMLVWPSIALGWVIGLYQQGTASMKRIRLILDAEPDITDGPAELQPSQMNGKIEYKNLNFSYEDTPILENINLAIPPRTTLGILGQTGSGKTTLVRLIPHLYPISPGQLFIDGQDINDYQLSSLREQIGYVTQDTFLFSDTLHNNIAFG